MSTFEDGQPEDLLAIVKNFRVAINDSVRTLASERINYLHTMLFRGDLKKLDELETHNSGTKNSHIKHIIEGLLGYLPPINALSNQKHIMRRTMCKPQGL